MMKKILIIAYSFPPVNGGRSLRAINFVKYLGDFGWEPIVLTVKKPVVPQIDYSLNRKLPSFVRVCRTYALEFKYFIEKKKYLTQNESPNFFVMTKCIIARLLKKIRILFFIPDYHLGWIPFALSAGLKIVRQKKIQAIMVIAEPFSSFLIGVLLKILTKKPLLLDFRDEWVPLEKYRDPDKSDGIIRWEAAVEEYFISQADIVTSVTEGIVSNFKRRYPQYAHKFHVIYNGFDPRDYKGISEIKGNSGELIITYAGSLYKKRFPFGFLKALEEIISEVPEIKDKIKWRILGSADGEVKEILSQFPFPEIIQLDGFREFSDTVEELQASHVLVLQEEADKDIACRYVPGKLYEYMGANKIILALASSGSLKDIVTKTNSGIVISPNNIPGIRKEMEGIYERFMNGTLSSQYNEVQVEKFHRQKLTGELSVLLDRMLAVSHE